MVRTHKVVAAVITANIDGKEKLLLMKRSEDDDNWPGRWCYLAEHIEEGESNEDALSRGLKEETGIESFEIVKGPVIIEKQDPASKDLFKIYLFHIRVYDDKIVLNYENDKFVWINIKDISMYSFESIDNIEEDLQDLGLI